jgi:hypothetical protein
MKILSFFIFFGVIFALPDPDPDPTAQINADPDPKPWSGCFQFFELACCPCLLRYRIFKENKVSLKYFLDS